VRFLLLGKLPDMPVMCLRLKNVIVPRLCGFNLGHELALIQLSNLFMGHGSGFAGMAWFSEVPYVITSMQKEGCSWVGYDSNIERFPFANDNQRIVFQTESVPLLNQHFETFYQEWKKGINSRTTVKSQDEVRTAFLFNTSEELKKELHEYVFAKIKAISDSAQPLKATATLSLLDEIEKEHPEFIDKVPLFHLVRATVLYQTQRFLEAKKVICKAVELEPSDKTIADVHNAIDVALKNQLIST
jgi:hypothetical protein